MAVVICSGRNEQANAAHMTQYKEESDMCEASVCAINGAAEHVGTNLLRLAEVHSDLSEISRATGRITLTENSALTRIRFLPYLDQIPAFQPFVTG